MTPQREHTVEPRTCFGAILQRAVEATPGAVGGAFADHQGEMVDCFARGMSSLDWALLTAHYGVILAHVRDALGIWHYGDTECFVARHAAPRAQSARPHPSDSLRSAINRGGIPAPRAEPAGPHPSDSLRSSIDRGGIPAPRAEPAGPHPSDSLRSSIHRGGIPAPRAEPAGPHPSDSLRSSIAIVVQAVGDGYYALLAVREPGRQRGDKPWEDTTWSALTNLRAAARALREEMV